MSLDYRVTPLPAEWPGKRTPSDRRTRGPFKSNWTRTLALLEREINHLGGKRVEIALAVEARFIRADGGLYSNSRPRSPEIIVSFTVGPDRLQFPSDAYLFWETNAHVVALTLERLRAIDRYGVQQGKQYQGFKAIAATSSTTLTTDQAAALIEQLTGIGTNVILRDATEALHAVRRARNYAHPDRPSGSEDSFHRVELARQALSLHHGRPL